MRNIYIATCIAALVATVIGCRSNANKVGFIEREIFVECDPTGFTVKNDGDMPWYVVASSFCTLNTKQLGPMGPGHVLPDLVLYSSSVYQPTPFMKTIQVGGSARYDLDMSKLGHCMDQTNAPPGQHTAEPVSLISKGPADAIHMHLNISDPYQVDGPKANIHVACKW